MFDGELSPIPHCSPFWTDELEWCIKYLELLSFKDKQEMRNHLNKTEAVVIDILLWHCIWSSHGSHHTKLL